MVVGLKVAAAVGIFVGGALFGKAGVSALKSNKAKKAYSHCTAAVLRGKDNVMKTAAALKENCGDIYADAVDINNRKYAEQEKARLEAAMAVIEEYKSREAAAESESADEAE